MCLNSLANLIIDTPIVSKILVDLKLHFSADAFGIDRKISVARTLNS